MELKLLKGYPVAASKAYSGYSWALAIMLRIVASSVRSAGDSYVDPSVTINDDVMAVIRKLDSGKALRLDDSGQGVCIDSVMEWRKIKCVGL